MNQRSRKTLRFYVSQTRWKKKKENEWKAKKSEVKLNLQSSGGTKCTNCFGEAIWDELYSPRTSQSLFLESGTSVAKCTFNSLHPLSVVCACVDPLMSPANWLPQRKKKEQFNFKRLCQGVNVKMQGRRYRDLERLVQGHSRPSSPTYGEFQVHACQFRLLRGRNFLSTVVWQADVPAMHFGKKKYSGVRCEHERIAALVRASERNEPYSSAEWKHRHALRLPLLLSRCRYYSPYLVVRLHIARNCSLRRHELKQRLCTLYMVAPSTPIIHRFTNVSSQ